MPVALATGNKRTSESKIFAVHEGPADHMAGEGLLGEGSGHFVARAVVTLWLEEWSLHGQGSGHSVAGVPDLCFPRPAWGRGRGTSLLSMFLKCGNYHSAQYFRNYSVLHFLSKTKFQLKNYWNFSPQSVSIYYLRYLKYSNGRA